MSKQKSNEPETAKEVTENLIEQTELEGMSQPEITESTSNEVVPDVIEEPAVPKNKKLNPKINTVATTTVKGDKKMDNNGKMRDISKVTMRMHHAVREDLLKYLESSLLEEIS